MGENEKGKLGGFLQETLDWDWKKFCESEKSFEHTGIQSVVFSLIRSCAEGELKAIKTAIDRVDGRVETPVKIQFPKVWQLFPSATSVTAVDSINSSFNCLAPPPEDIKLELPDPSSLPEIEPEVSEEQEEKDKSIAVLSLRETLDKMASQEKARVICQLILKRRQEVEDELKEKKEVVDGDDVRKKIPLVKSVIAANLLHLAIEKNNLDAVNEVFERIDGKLTEVIKVLGPHGENIFLTSFVLQAPYGAVKNKDGIYMMQSEEVTEVWKQKLKKD